MFAKLYTLALAASLVSAITFNTISDAANGGTMTVTWSASSTDPPYMTLELVNPSFNSLYAVSNNVQVSQGQLTFSVPEVPVSQYTLQAVATNNINDVLSSSNAFSITAPSSASGSASSTSSGSSITFSSLSSTSTSTGSSTSFTLTSTTPVSSALPSSSSSSTSTTPTPTSFTSGAGSFKLVGVAPAAALIFSAIAGAAMVF